MAAHVFCCVAYTFVEGVNVLKTYKTIKGEAFGEFTEKRSRFICYGKHVKTQDEAESYINYIKSKHWDAKHNVYAYCIKNQNIKRSSDDGEPKGTAGAPLLMKIEGLGLEDVVIVITRYFGGVLLGTGGLVRAYSHGAEVAANACGIVEMKPCIIAQLRMSYKDFGKSEGIIRESCADILDIVYTDSVEIQFCIEGDKFDKLKSYIDEISGGKSEICVKGKDFYPVKK